MHVIGTAGHVDHGKSTLVQALTGIDPDRLAEEKAREMTIDLGFAWMMLDGEEVGIVDVPGHRDFIENMLAGVGGIDVALFVIAADEGIMPQTREHLAILDLLEIEHGVVALTKHDLVDDPDWLELVMLEVADALQETALAGSPIVPVSARTGVGLDKLRQALAEALRSVGEIPDWSRPRLPIDRVFTLTGFGTVVTGTLLDGRFSIGDEVEVQPDHLSGRIRGLQTHKHKREVVHPGSRVAINLSGIDRADLRRGQVVAARGALRGTHLLDAAYRHLPDVDYPLLHNEEVKLFVGAAEALARVRVIGRENIPPGEEGWIQLRLSAPVAVARGDHFILRRSSPGMTLGGGRVLDPHPGRRHRRFRPDVSERFETLARGAPEEILLRALVKLGPLSREDLMAKTAAAPEGGPALQRLIDDGLVIRIGKSLMAASHWQALRERFAAELTEYHYDMPLRPGIDREALRSRLNITPVVFNALREALVADGAVVESGTLLRFSDHQVRFTAEQEAAIAQLMRLFESGGVLSPSVKECKAVVGDSIYSALVDLGRIKPVSEDVVYSSELYNRLIEQLTTYLHQHGSISPAEARDLLGASRKYTIALLEHLDELHVTIRSGETRLPARKRIIPTTT